MDDFDNKKAFYGEIEKNARRLLQFATGEFPVSASCERHSHGEDPAHHTTAKDGHTNAKDDHTEDAVPSSWTARPINVPSCIYLLVVHVGAALGVCATSRADTATLWLAFLLLFLSELGITAGAHRLWSHRSYTAALPFRIFLAGCAQLANQGSIYHWVRDHRVHHLCSETVADPHDATQGIFFAHMGWLMVKKEAAVAEKGKTIDMSDILADPVVYVDKILFPFSNLLMCFVFGPGIAVYGWNESWWTTVMVCGFLRYTTGLHHTWLVNSLAHMHGERPYDENIHPAENWIVTIASCGEGWHNYHHSYPFDYSASEHGWDKQYNPTTFVIDLAAVFQLVWDRKKATRNWEGRKARKERARLAEMNKSTTEAEENAAQYRQFLHKIHQQ